MQRGKALGTNQKNSGAIAPIIASTYPREPAMAMKTVVN
jgi:hypothetical protein